MCTYVSGPLVRAFQFHSQTLVGPLLSVWSDLTGADDFRESSTRYATFSDGSSISLGQNKKAKENASHIIISPHVRLSGFQNPGDLCLWNPKSQEIFACGIRNPESSALKSVMQLKKSKIPLTTGIQNTSSADKESGIQYPESGIDSVESRIQDCPGLPYMVRVMT